MQPTFLLVDEVVLDMVLLEVLEVGCPGGAVVKVVVDEIVDDISEGGAGQQSLGHGAWEDGQVEEGDGDAEEAGWAWGEHEAIMGALYRGIISLFYNLLLMYLSGKIP